MQVSVDQDLCTGCGLCADSCPDVFEMDDDKARVISNQVPDDLEDCSQDAADSCPSEAIILEE